MSTRCIGVSVLDEGTSGAEAGITLWDLSMGRRGRRRWEEMRRVRGRGGGFLVVARRKDGERVMILRSEVVVGGCTCSPWQRGVGCESTIRVPTEKCRVVDAVVEGVVVVVGGERRCDVDGREQ
jgi:hypothetical protein